MTTATTIKWPFGVADYQLVNAGTGTLTPVITNSKTILKYTAPAGAVTLNLSIDSEVKAGSELIIYVDQTTTGRDFTLGTGFDAEVPDLTGVASDSDVIILVYDGTAFLAVSTWQKVVDAP